MFRCHRILTDSDRVYTGGNGVGLKADCVEQGVASCGACQSPLALCDINSCGEGGKVQETGSDEQMDTDTVLPQVDSPFDDMNCSKDTSAPNVRDSLKISHINVNGWGKTQLKEKVALFHDADIVSLNETHLLGMDTIVVKGYQWFGKNWPSAKRTHAHGGIRFLV